MRRLIVSIILLLVGAFAFQSFQCSSKEMTSAKVAFDQSDFDKARNYINQELQNNPNSTEAYQLLAEINIKQGNWQNAAKNSNKAYENATEQQVIDNIKRLQNKIWTECYNKGLNFYNLNLSKSDPALLDSAYNMFKAGSIVRPTFEDFYYLMAITKESAGDTAESINYYKRYIEVIQPELDFMLSAGTSLNMPRTESLQKYGEPSKTFGQSANRTGDSVLIDLYQSGGKESYVFYYSENRGPFRIMGLRVNAPDNWLDNEKRLPAEMKKSPFAALSQIYFQRRELEKSLEYAEMITRIDPSDQQASRFVIELYTRMDKVDEAKQKLDAFIKEDPDNKLFYAQYGDIYLNNQEPQKAIKQYEKALEIDPEFPFALRNVASAYKNYASILQDEQQAKLDEDPDYEINTDEYFPLLKKSAQYFERSLNTKEFKNDYQVLGELTNIYSVVEDEQKLKVVIKNLEAIEFSIPPSDKENYYYILLKVYSDMGDDDKMKVIQRKLDTVK